MTKCGVCGSENEAEALFCGTCGSPLSPAEATAIAAQAKVAQETVAGAPDDVVVPGKGDARRDLGIGGGADRTTVTPKPDGIAGADGMVVDDETHMTGPTIACGVCGTVNDATRTYCRKCANELKPAAPPPPPPPPPGARGRISPIAIGLGAAAVVVAIVLVGVLVFGGGTPAASLGPTAASSQAPGVSVAPSNPEVTVAPTEPGRTFTEGDISGLIAFARCPADASACVIFVRTADASAKAVAVTGEEDGSATDPGLSHDQTRVVYSAASDVAGESGLRIVTIDSLSYVQHSTGRADTNAVFSPDDQQLAFAGHRARNEGSSDSDFEVRIDVTDADVQSTALTKNDIDDHDPSFTPDGLSIVFVQGDGDGRELRMITISSGAITDLTTDEFADEDPAVSPDGTEVVFASTRAGSGEFDLYLLNLSTLVITPLPAMSGDEHDPAWSPGGRYIVFSGDGANGKDLFILDLADSSVDVYTSAAGDDLTPSWQ